MKYNNSKEKLLDWLTSMFVLCGGRFVSWWYSLTMKITRKLGSDYSLPLFIDAVSIHERIKYAGHYVEDPLEGKLDYLAHPTLIEKRIRNKKSLGDCDDHGIYWASNLLKSILCREVWFCSIQYKRDSKRKGHVICVWRDSNHQLWWADYDYPKKIDSLWGWLDRYYNDEHVTVLGAMMIPVVSIDYNDTPKFGKDIKVRVP